MKKLLIVIVSICLIGCTFYYEDPSLKSSENVEILSAVDSTKVVYVVERESETYFVKDGRVTHQLLEETYFPIIMTIVLLLVVFLWGFGIGRN